MSTRLAPEITDAIIDHLHSDYKTLKTCSIVCGSWFLAARYHLFIRKTAITITPRNCHAFLDILNSPYSTIRPYIRYLVIDGGMADPQFSHALSLLPHLHAVERLDLESMVWDDIGAAAKVALLSHFDRVTKLDLRVFECTSASHLVDILCSFPFLEELTIDRFKSRIGGGTLAAPASCGLTLSHLRRLHLTTYEDIHNNTFLPWLLDIQPPLPLSDIRVGWVFDTNQHSGSIADFLKGLGPRLKYLQFFASSARLLRGIDLSHNEELCSVHISDLAIDDRVRDPSFILLTKFLCQIATPKLQEVSFGIRVAFQWRSSLSLLNLSILEQRFIQPRFSHLRRITFVIVPFGYFGKAQAQRAFRNTIESNIREMMPNSQGILQFA